MCRLFFHSFSKFFSKESHNTHNVQAHRSLIARPSCRETCKRDDSTIKWKRRYRNGRLLGVQNNLDVTQWTFYAIQWKPFILRLHHFFHIFNAQLTIAYVEIWFLRFIWFVTIWNRLHDLQCARFAANDDALCLRSMFFLFALLLSFRVRATQDLHMNDKCAEPIPAELTVRLHKFFFIIINMWWEPNMWK